MRLAGGGAGGGGALLGCVHSILLLERTTEWEYFLHTWALNVILFILCIWNKCFKQTNVKYLLRFAQ